MFIDSDVIIYDLNTCDLAEAEFAIKSKKKIVYIYIFIYEIIEKSSEDG